MEGGLENGGVGRVVWWVGDSSMETALTDMLAVAFSMSLMAARYLDITFPFSQTIFPPLSHTITKSSEFKTQRRLIKN